MHRIVNRTNSPHKIRLADGTEGRVPAMGEAVLDVHPKWLPHYRVSGYLDVSEATDKPQLDHDRNGEAGGSKPADERGIDDLRARYEDLTGDKPDGRWGEKRLQEEIGKAAG